MSASARKYILARWECKREWHKIRHMLWIIYRSCKCSSNICFFFVIFFFSFCNDVLFFCCFLQAACLVSVSPLPSWWWFGRNRCAMPSSAVHAMREPEYNTKRYHCTCIRMHSNNYMKLKYAYRVFIFFLWTLCNSSHPRSRICFLVITVREKELGILVIDAYCYVGKQCTIILGFIFLPHNVYEKRVYCQASSI